MPEQRTKIILYHDQMVLAERQSGSLYTGPEDTGIRDLIRNEPVEIGTYENSRYLAAELADDSALPENGLLVPLRHFADRTDPRMFALVSRGAQLLYWGTVYRLCPRCGEPLVPAGIDFGKTCGTCGLQIFPPVSPAIIVGVVKGDTLLLAHNVRFPGDIHSLIAGFVEPGETIEECARREVYEETSVEIDSIRYFGSQTWPFPHSLMIGLTAVYAGGEIKVDGVEIDRAGWFSRDALPPLPGCGSISRRIIDWFRGFDSCTPE